MIETLKKYIRRRVIPQLIEEHEVVEAYNLWALNYDAQPGNLMLDLDEILFSKLLASIDIKGKMVADIGCGTGRHWAKIFKAEPASLAGFDVSPGMLDKLKEKFPVAETHTITDNQFAAVSDGSYDVIVSTLTVAHIPNLEEALNAWCRIAKPAADMVITDFHPDALAFGGKRTFKHENKQIAIQNFVHSTHSIKDILKKNGFYLVNEEERKVDETVRHYYEEKNALPVYEKFKGFPIIYAMHLRRGK